jgi:hypothetical protein
MPTAFPVHETEAEAVDAIRELFEAGSAVPGGFYIVELAPDRRVVRVFEVETRSRGRRWPPVQRRSRRPTQP